MDDIHTLLGAEDAALLKARCQAVAHFMRAADKDKASAEIRAAMPLLKGMSTANLYKLAAQFDPARPLRSLMDGRQVRRLMSGGVAVNDEFKAYWHQLCLENRRKTAPAYRQFLRNLQTGETVPGFGTWRDIYASEHGGVYPHPDMACPYSPEKPPKGLTLRNLNRIKPDEWALVAARKGTMAAAMECLPDVKRTRVGLKSCRVVQIDDMWYEHKVAFGLNRKAQRVVEFSMIDVATGNVFAYLPKPVLEREDGTRETLRAKWTRYLIADLLGRIGVPDEGVLIMGEHGTASADGDLRETLARISGGRIEFGAGGLLSKPFYEGGFGGQPKGNPRYKGLLEGFHALIKNELAAVAGHMGGGREGKSEYVYGMEKTDDKLRKIIAALEPVRPGIRSRLVMPFMDYYDFRAIIDAAYMAINSRRSHNLEGWEQMGFMVDVYREASGTWTPVRQLLESKDVPDIIKTATVQAIQDGTVESRRERISPLEAWNLRASDRTWRIAPSVVATEIMGLELARQCACDNQLKLRYKDLESFSDVEVSGVLEGGGSLTRGDNYLVWINPFEPLKAYVADVRGRFIGTAKVIQEHRYDDLEGIKKAIHVRNVAMGLEKRKVEGATKRMAMKAAAVSQQNAVEILGEDPALKAAVADAATHEIGNAEGADLDLEYTVDENDTISGDEIAGL